MYRRGFTIVELLIVIVIIGILAALVMGAYNGIQDKARVAKIQTDEKELIKAIISARQSTGNTLLEITGNTWTADSCFSQDSGTNLATIPKTDACWVTYMQALDDISTASESNVRNITDPWGRPYYIDENEGEDPFDQCQEDIIGVYSYPFENYGSTMYDFFIPLSLPESSC